MAVRAGHPIRLSRERRSGPLSRTSRPPFHVRPRRAVVRPSTLASMTLAPLRRLPVALVLFAVLAAWPVSALGHAALATVTPADKTTVQGSPTEIAVTFTQNLDPAKSSIRVVDAAGTVVVQGGTV